MSQRLFRFFFPAWLTIGLSLALLQAPARAEGENLLRNGDFARGGLFEWHLFLPADGLKLGCRIGAVEGAGRSGGFAAALDGPVDTATGRFGIVQSIPVAPGQRLRVSAWVRADPEAALNDPAHNPGPYLRALFRTATGQDLDGALYEVGLLGRVEGRQGSLATLGSGSLPGEWTRCELVVAVPPDGGLLEVGLFSCGVAGRLLWDGVGVETVPPETPLTPPS